MNVRPPKRASSGGSDAGEAQLWSCVAPPLMRTYTLSPSCVSNTTGTVQPELVVCQSDSSMSLWFGGWWNELGKYTYQRQ